jgi:phosphoribosyl 1,2-cyclic phosphodiesterase
VTLRFASLGSGSRGNALLVEHDDTLLMIDCGLPRRDAVRRLAALGREPRDIHALLVTHEHGDHVRGVGAFAARYGTPVLATAGTASAAKLTNLPSLRVISYRSGFACGALTVEPFTVPHDAREPCQFAFRAARRCLAVLTDTGHVTPHILERLDGVHALAVECNHDLDSLWSGPYPESVKRRVSSRFGHLDNRAAADVVRRVERPDLQWVMALHLSERNNSAGQVRGALEPVLGASSERLHIATQDIPSAWLSVD